MKIICESKEEYEQVMEASEYLHNFSYEVHKPLEPWDCDKIEETCLDFNIPIVNAFAHLHVAPEGVVQIRLDYGKSKQ